jgi:hypothetical protein
LKPATLLTLALGAWLLYYLTKQDSMAVAYDVPGYDPYDPSAQEIFWP